MESKAVERYLSSSTLLFEKGHEQAVVLSVNVGVPSLFLISTEQIEEEKEAEHAG